MRILLNALLISGIALAACSHQDDTKSSNIGKTQSAPDTVKRADTMTLKMHPKLVQAIKQMTEGDTAAAVESIKASGVPIDIVLSTIGSDALDAAKEGKLKSAEISFRLLHKLSPDHVAPVLGLMQVYRDQKKTPQAIALATDFLKRNPKSDVIRGARGGLYAEMGDPKKALTDVDAVLKTSPMDAYAYGTKVFVLAETGKPKEAIAAANKALEINPDFAYLYNNRGYAYLQLGELDKAEKDINESLKRDSNNAFAYRNLALLAIKTNKTTAVCPALKTAYTKQHIDLVRRQIDSLSAKYCR